MPKEKMVKVVTVCSECGEVLNERILPEEDVPLPEQRVSHSFCEKCLAKQLAELDEMPAIASSQKK